MSGKDEFMNVMMKLEREFGHGTIHFDDMCIGNEELDRVLNNIDSEVRGKHIREVYEGYGSPLGAELTSYGSYLSFLAACIRLVGKLKRGETTNAKNPLHSMFFAYVVYWNLGDDFLLGNIVENELRDAGQPPEPTDNEWIGYKVWRELWIVWRHYYFPLYNPKISGRKPQKPPFQADLIAEYLMT